MTNYLDARTDAVEDSVDCELCIIGAGAAGITLARRLAGVYGDLVLMEAGSFEFDYATQQLYLGRNLGLPYYDLQGCRLRYFGGTTNHWSGYNRANDPIDYEGRPELGVPAWPVHMDEIQPFVDEAAHELGIRAQFFDATYYTRELGFPASVLFEANSPAFETKIFQIARERRFGQLYREELGKAPGLRVLLNLNAVHLQLTADGNRLQSVRAATTTGKNVTVRAKVFVLACHAIENARLLLASDDIQKTGVGNTYDQVGRYFMEHPYIVASKLIPSKRFSIFYDWKYALRRDLNANLSLSARAMKDLGILQYYCRFDPVYAEKDVRDAISGPSFDRQVLEDLVTVLGDFSDAIENELNARDIVNTLPAYYRLEHRIEQAPNANSRVTLSDERDSLGTRCADVNWSLREVDYDTFREGHDLVVRELSALGAGRFILDELTPELIDATVSGKYHHMGTTRMSATPRDGVVDSNARVHGVDNLYVMGSSIFPTSGYSGPTMMIVAFTLRLAEHLKSRAAGLVGAGSAI
jgi:choline dehydrogenase-like flavoprotein